MSILDKEKAGTLAKENEVQLGVKVVRWMRGSIRSRKRRGKRGSPCFTLERSCMSFLWRGEREKVRKVWREVERAFTEFVNQDGRSMCDNIRNRES